MQASRLYSPFVVAREWTVVGKSFQLSFWQVVKVVGIHATKAYRGSLGISAPILNLGTRTRWRCVASFTPRPSYPRGMSSRYPLNRRLGGRFVEEINLLSLPEFEPRIDVFSHCTDSPSRLQFLFCTLPFRNCIDCIVWKRAVHMNYINWKGSILDLF